MTYTETPWIHSNAITRNVDNVLAERLVSRLVCLFVLGIWCDVMLVCVVRDHYVMFSLLILAQYMTAGQTGFRSFETSSMSSLVGVLACIHLDCVVVCNVALVIDLNLFTWNSLLPYGMTVPSIWWFVRDSFPLKVDNSLLYVHMCIYVYMCVYEPFQTMVYKSGQLVLISKRVSCCVRMFVWEAAFWQLGVIEAAASWSVRFSAQPISLQILGCIWLWASYAIYCC